MRTAKKHWTQTYTGKSLAGYLEATGPEIMSIEPEGHQVALQPSGPVGPLGATRPIRGHRPIGATGPISGRPGHPICTSSATDSQILAALSTK